METKQILFYLIIAVLVYLIYNFFFKDHTVADLQGMHNAKVSLPIDSKNLPSAGGSNDYTFSVWIYVNTWSHKYGAKKTILRRATSSTETDEDGQKGEPIPEIYLDGYTNDLMIKLATYASGSSGSKGNIDDCNIKNIPLQKWVHILMAVNGRTNDVYIDGKLVKTCMLAGVAMLDKLGSLTLCPDGGFSGYTSKLRYYARAVNPREAYEIYKEGFSDSWLGESASKYKLKLAFFSDGTEMNSWSV